MVKNQEQFNEKYPNKEVKEIEITRNRNFQGELIIEDYSELEKLNLREVKSIEKIILKNLPNLKDCAIWKCNTKELVIENCPQIKTLNVRRNLLTNLEFIKDLDNLEILEVDGNDKLSEILEPYEDDWKDYQKDLQESNKDINTLKLLENIQALKKENEFLSIKYDELKKFLKGVLISLSQEEKNELAIDLDKKIKRKASLSAPGMTKELMLNTEKVVKSLKEIKKELENELAGSKGELKSKKEEIERMSKTIDKAIVAPKVQQNIQNAVYGSQSINTKIIQQRLEFIELKQKYQALDSVNEPASNPQKLKKTILFLAAKKTFAETRQNTINNLIDIYADKSGKKLEKVQKVGDTISEIGSFVPGAEAATKIVGKSVSKCADFFKKNFLAEQAQNFEDYLIGDEKALELLKETYRSLENSFQNNQNKLSTIASILKLDQNQPQLDQHSVFKIGDFKSSESLTIGKMSQIIEALDRHLEAFVKMLQQEAEKCDQELELLTKDNGELPNEIERLLNELVGENEQTFQSQAQIQIPPK